jgi:hypothetical protein
MMRAYRDKESCRYALCVFVRHFNGDLPTAGFAQVNGKDCHPDMT